MKEDENYNLEEFDNNKIEENQNNNLIENENDNNNKFEDENNDMKEIENKNIEEIENNNIKENENINNFEDKENNNMEEKNNENIVQENQNDINNNDIIENNDNINENEKENNNNQNGINENENDDKIKKDDEYNEDFEDDNKINNNINNDDNNNDMNKEEFNNENENIENNLIINKANDEEIFKKEDMNNNQENNEINNQNDIDENRTENNINEIQNIEKEDMQLDTNENEKNCPTVIEGKFRSLGVITNKLSPKELQRMVESNYELMDTSEEVEQNKEEHESKLKTASELEKEIKEKDQIYEMLFKSNNELKKKITMSQKKYNDIVQKIEAKKNNHEEEQLVLQIKEMQKEIEANETETERYKKLIYQTRNSVNFKINLEKSSNFKRILKEETIKNAELQKELNNLQRLQRVQDNYYFNYKKDYQVPKKNQMLEKEIKKTRNFVEEHQKKYEKLEQFLKLVHEKIINVGMNIRREKPKKEEPKPIKSFTRDELKFTLNELGRLRSEITEKRNQLNLLTKQNDQKISKMMAQNKKIEDEFKENDILNKRLLFKRNEVKRNIRNITVNGVNNNQGIPVKNKYKITNRNIFNNPSAKNKNEIVNNEIDNNNNNNNLEHELEYDAEFNEPDNNENNNIGQKKLFRKNPNKKMENNFEEIENLNYQEGVGYENMEQDNDAVENDNINDSNLNMKDNNNDNIEVEGDEF